MQDGAAETAAVFVTRPGETHVSERVIAPKSRGFLFLDSHPGGCRQLVDEMWQAVPAPAPAGVKGRWPW
ncbi:hypothetical protein STANM309S_06420 [Streptomyces tanashiensis]